MKRSNSTPARFMTIPWNPAGRPNRNSSRISAQSGAQDIVVENRTTSRPENSSVMNTTPITPLAMAVPMAAPAVPNAGIGPSPRMRMTFSTMLSAVITSPRRNGVRASPAARSAPFIMKKISIPMLNTNTIRI